MPIVLSKSQWCGWVWFGVVGVVGVVGVFSVFGAWCVWCLVWGGKVGVDEKGFSPMRAVVACGLGA